MPIRNKISCETSLFGVSVVFECDSAGVADAAASLFPRSRSEPAQGTKVYVVIEKRVEGHGARSGIEDVRGAHLAVKRENVELIADGAAGRGSCTLHGAASVGEFQDAIQTVVLFLVAHAGRIPLHASAIMLGNNAVVFAGPSGSGKSTLSLAAERAGLPVLSDDTVFVQTDPTLRIWSFTQAIHVLDEDAPAGNTGGWRHRSGRWKRAVPITKPAAYAEEAVLCVLARGEAASLEPLEPEQAVAELTRNPDPGYEFYGERSVHAVRALAGDRAWRLVLSRDPAEAIALVRRTFPAGT